jgi:hypothetical protein
MAQFDKNETTPQSSTAPKSNLNSSGKDDSITHKVGDVVERVGEKLKEMGADKVGSAVYNAGNKLEHKDQAKKH